MTDAAQKLQRRVAAIDMGSNSVRLHIADVSFAEDGTVLAVDTVDRELHVTRLAQDVDVRGILIPAAITRTRIALTEYNQRAHKHGAAVVLLTATSAVRDADNGEAFLGEIEHSYGFQTRLLTGDEEAEMMVLGATSDNTIPSLRAGVTGILDIGGGSTELVVLQNGELFWRTSWQLGCVRLTERTAIQQYTGEWTAQDLARAHEEVVAATSTPWPDAPVAALVGVAGTATTIAAIHHGIATWTPNATHGLRVTRADVQHVLQRLAAMPLEERKQVAGLRPERAEVIVAGMVILDTVMERLGLESYVASECDILDGATIAAAKYAWEHDVHELPTPFGGTPC